MVQLEELNEKINRLKAAEDNIRIVRQALEAEARNLIHSKVIEGKI